MTEIPDAIIDWIKTISSDDKRPEIQRAIRAIQSVLTTRRQIPRAIYRHEIGWIGFQYGHHHAKTKTRNRSGHGLAHIIGSATEERLKNASYPSAGQIISLIPEIIFDGAIKPSHSNRLSMELKQHRVLLTKAAKHSPNWLFHAYKIHEQK